MVAWILASAPTGARLLEIGSGDGVLTERLATAGVDVLGVDPNGTPSAHVCDVPVEELDAEPFDIVFASVSLHHLPDPECTTAALRRLTKHGTVLLVREFDRVLLDDERTLRWWYRQRQAHETVHPEPDHVPLPESFADFVAGWREHMAHHVLPWATVRGVIHDAGFETESEVATPYLYRWALSEPVRALEEALIGEGRINQVGIRWAGRRAR
jgi:SAM-dependent methyltransferase